MKKSYVFLAYGFEEIEALTPVDVLRRAGMDVKTVSIGATAEVIGAHGVTVKADMMFADADYADAEWLILPGGLPGAVNLHEHEGLGKLLKAHAEKGKVAAICASPAMVLAPLGLLEGKAATGYPGTEEGLLAGGAEVCGDRVVTLDRVVTGNGPSSSLLFALAIVANSLGQAKADEIAAGMLAK